MANKRVENINPHILRLCRKQIGLSIEQAQKKAGLKSLADIEAGKKYPTIMQLEKIAGRYQVPVWVFLKEELPERYRFNKSVAFRQFQNSITNDYEVRSVIARVERFRELLLELRDDMGEPVQPFSPPLIGRDHKSAAEVIRQWLGYSEKAYSLEERKQLVENKNIFVFMTSKYPGWSKVRPSVQGFAIYNELLPIIVINSSDAYRAQSFTLFHELGHLLHKKSALDERIEPVKEIETDEERWCNQFAGEVLMPEYDFLEVVEDFVSEAPLNERIKQIDKLAKIFKVSSYAFLVRLKYLNIITVSAFREIEKQLSINYENSRRQQKENKIPISRNIAKEALAQYGNIYTKAVIQTYHNQEIGLHKLCQLLGIKKARDALKLESLL
ncbi:MAG: ImmA/IrrE family metallo-endopeptidase [Chromatiales bacterium]|nr:ImmA/IrrE family metallo-endopeptidase [Chromatiales bacterium]